MECEWVRMWKKLVVVCSVSGFLDRDKIVPSCRAKFNLVSPLELTLAQRSVASTASPPPPTTQYGSRYFLLLDHFHKVFNLFWLRTLCTAQKINTFWFLGERRIQFNGYNIYTFPKTVSFSQLLMDVSLLYEV
jgi:hypothetical protein